MEEERIGDLYLGMTENELIQLLGEPKEISNSGVVIDEYGYRRICWWYDLGSDNTQYRTDVQLELIDCGDGFFVNTIYLLPEAELFSAVRHPYRKLFRRCGAGISKDRKG